MCAMQPVWEMTLCDQGLILSLLFGIHFRDFRDLLVTGKCSIDLLLIGSFAMSLRTGSLEGGFNPPICILGLLYSTFLFTTAVSAFLHISGRVSYWDVLPERAPRHLRCPLCSP